MAPVWQIQAPLAAWNSNCCRKGMAGESVHSKRRGSCRDRSTHHLSQKNPFRVMSEARDGEAYMGKLTGVGLLQDKACGLRALLRRLASCCSRPPKSRSSNELA